MTSKWNLLFAALATTLLLTACGTDSGNENKEPVTDEPVVVVEETDDVTGEENKEPVTDEVASAVDKTTGSSETGLLDKAKLTESDAQNFVLSVLPGYILTSEEPGKDSLIVEGDESIFMRIETGAKENDTYNYLVENTSDILAASSDGKTPVELTEKSSLPSGDDIKNAKAFSVETESGKVTGAVFERGDMVVRLTIFDTKEAKHVNPFLRMAETIVKK